MSEIFDIDMRAGEANGAYHIVEIQKPIPYPSPDEWALLEADCAERGIPFIKAPRHEWLERPWITVDGHVHSATKWWILNLQDEMSEEYVNHQVSDLRMWIDWLVNHAGKFARNEFESDVFIAMDDWTYRHKTLKDFKRWLMNSRPDEEGGKIEGARWNQILGSIKRFHIELEFNWNVPAPFSLHQNDGEYGSSWTTGLESRDTNESAGVPIPPELVEVLADACDRIDRAGKRHTSNIAERDRAFLELALACGMRLGGLAHFTIFEIPNQANAMNGWVSLRVPDRITKGRAGGVCKAFDHRIQIVRDFINGDRKYWLEERKEEGKLRLPEDPIFIAADDDGNAVADIDGWLPKGAKKKRSWNKTSAKERMRLVLPDGTPAAIWLSYKTGLPLTRDAAGDIIPNAAHWAMDHIDKNFPDFLTTHDCRHTYAHSFYFVQRMRHYENPAEGWIKKEVEDILQEVQRSLGHRDIETTRNTYLSNFEAFYDSGITIDQIMGES